MKKLSTGLTVLGLAALSASAAIYGTLTNTYQYYTNSQSGAGCSSTVVTTNTSGNAVSIAANKDAQIAVVYTSYGTNAAAPSATVGFDLYEPNLGVWTTTQPIQVTANVVSNGVALGVGKLYLSQTNFLGFSMIRWSTAVTTGSTNGLFQIDFIQGN